MVQHTYGGMDDAVDPQAQEDARNCNRALGLLRDSPSVITAAVEYLKCGGTATITARPARSKPQLALF
jgi:hypothetical protein